MATIHIFSVRDSAADSFGNPFTMVSRGLAIRAFSDEVNNPETLFSKHPNDFELWFVGDFDLATGNLVASPPAMIFRGVDVVRPA